MRLTPFFAFFLVLGSALAADAEDVVSVFVTTAEGKPADLTGWTASITLESKGFAPRTAALELKVPTPAQPRADAPEHGGHVVKTDGEFSVELVGGWSPGAGGLGPFFEGHVSIQAWECPMKCRPPVDKAGKCEKCGMELEQAEGDFTATVTFKTPAREVVAKGLSLPPPVPATYAEATAEAKAQLGRALLSSAAVPRVRRIAQIAAALTGTAPADQKDSVKAKTKAIRQACGDVLEALLSGKDASEFLKTLEKKILALPESGGK